MAQQIIDLGTSANAGDGDNLRSAMDKTNDNFTEVYTAGPVGSNISITNNSISSTNTNGNITLATDGTGVIQIANDIIPDVNNTRWIGTANNRPMGIYVGSAGLIADGPINVPDFANATVRDSTITTPVQGMIVVTANVYQGYIGSAWTALAGSAGISAVADDTSPQLGGNLSLASFNIDGTGSINITGAVTASANVTGGNITTGGVVTFADSTIQSTAFTSGSIVSVTTAIDFSSTNRFDGPTISLNDTMAVEILDITNSSGSVGRLTLPNVTVLGKTVYLGPNSLSPGNGIYLDYYRTGNVATSTGEIGGDGNSGRPMFVWLNGWVFYNNTV